VARAYSIMLAEPHLLLREKMAGILSRSERIWCVTQVDSLNGLTRGISDLQPDFILADIVILMDPETLKKIRRSSASSRVIALVDSKTEPYVAAARRLGLDGIIEKGHVEESILKEIRALGEPGEDSDGKPS
jgi:DNA-binding NarL/FixJ family response regulator